jgi:hypothetical protein
MLFSRNISELAHQDIEEFCKRFRENTRVEYKSTFDHSVKRKLPKILSSFANSYGGVLVVGVNASNGVPEGPFEGISFEDPEPRLTVENICRSGIFPEPVIYQNLVPSRASGKAFLVVQVNESPKAPHAIENSTQVYVRTGDSANPTTLADLTLVERLLLRRRDVLTRWNDFYAESTRLAEVAGLALSVPSLELRIGPLYPTETVVTREKVFAFISSAAMQDSMGFGRSNIARHPVGALLSRNDRSTRYLNIGDLGTVHYLEPLSSFDEDLSVSGPGGERRQTQLRTYELWPVTVPMLKALGVSAELMKTNGVTCDMRIEAKLANVAKVTFTLGFGRPPMSLPVSTLSSVIPASVSHSSESLREGVQDIAVELLYQLRWSFGTQEPQTRDQIRDLIARQYPSERIFEE